MLHLSTVTTWTCLGEGEGRGWEGRAEEESGGKGMGGEGIGEGVLCAYLYCIPL